MSRKSGWTLVCELMLCLGITSAVLLRGGVAQEPDKRSGVPQDKSVPSDQPALPQIAPPPSPAIASSISDLIIQMRQFKDQKAQLDERERITISGITDKLKQQSKELADIGIDYIELARSAAINVNIGREHDQSQSLPFPPATPGWEGPPGALGEHASIGRLINELKAIRSKKAVLEAAEKAAIATIKEKVKQQSFELSALGLNPADLSQPAQPSRLEPNKLSEPKLEQSNLHTPRLR
jgi:hypothetical protein